MNAATLYVQYKGEKGSIVFAEIGEDDGFIVMVEGLMITNELFGTYGDAVQEFIEYVERINRRTE